MPFLFSLSPLLRLRQSLEHQKALSLQKASLALIRGQQTLAEFDRFIAESALADAASLTAGRTGADLRFAALLQEQLDHYRTQLAGEVHDLSHSHQQAVQAYQEAYRAREVLETLRLRQRREYQVEQLRREQRELDAAHLLQRWHRQDG